MGEPCENCGEESLEKLCKDCQQLVNAKCSIQAERIVDLGREAKANGMSMMEWTSGF
jgi:hypothetical protein